MQSALGAAGDSSRLAAAYAEAESLEHKDAVPQALELTERSIQNAKAAGDTYWHVKFRLKKVELLTSQGQTAEAAKLLQSVELPRPEIAELKALLAMEKGELCLRDRQPKSAVENFLAAESAARSDRYDPLRTNIELKLGTAYLDTGQTALAEEHVRRAASLVTVKSDSYTRLSVQGELGYVLIRQQRYDEAIPAFERAIEAGNGSGLQIIQAINLLNLGFVYSQVGDADRAAPLLDQAAKIFAAFHRTDEMQLALLSLGDTALDHGDFALAEDSFRRAAALARTTQTPASQFRLAESLSGLVTTALERRDQPAAMQFQDQVTALLKSARITDPNLLVQNDLNEARTAQGSGDFARAQKLFHQAASKEDVDVRLALEGQVRLAQLLAETGKPGEAESAFRVAVQRFDASRSRFLREESRLAYDSALIYLFQQYVEFLTSQGRHTEAFELAESSRARLLLEHRVAASASGLAQFRSLAARAKATLLFYWTGPRRSWLWTITPSNITPFALPPERTLRSLVASYRHEVETLGDPAASGGSAGWQLSAALLGPVRSALGKNAKIIAVPGGALFNINLASLPVDKARPHYFVEDAEVTVVPSLSLLLEPHVRRQSLAFRLLAMGDVVSPDRAKYPDLPNAASEIQALNELFSGAVTTRIHAEAAPGAYRDANPAQFSMIHFAAHAESNPVDPLDSAVILSRQGDRFKLYAREIERLPIAADLVTISACHSAGARTYAGEGLVGFSWAFLAAGARHVVAGLWDVDDRSTAVLMKGVYSSIKAGARPSEALRKAQLQLVKSSGAYRKPYYWAPFEVFARTID